MTIKPQRTTVEVRLDDARERLRRLEATPSGDGIKFDQANVGGYLNIETNLISPDPDHGALYLLDSGGGGIVIEETSDGGIWFKTVGAPSGTGGGSGINLLGGSGGVNIDSADKILLLASDDIQIAAQGDLIIDDLPTSSGGGNIVWKSGGFLRIG